MKSKTKYIEVLNDAEYEILGNFLDERGVRWSDGDMPSDWSPGDKHMIICIDRIKGKDILSFLYLDDYNNDVDAHNSGKKYKDPENPLMSIEEYMASVVK